MQILHLSDCGTQASIFVLLFWVPSFLSNSSAAETLVDLGSLD